MAASQLHLDNKILINYRRVNEATATLMQPLRKHLSRWAKTLNMHIIRKSINYKLIFSLTLAFFSVFCLSFFTMLPSDSGPEPSFVIKALEVIATFPAISLFVNVFASSIFLFFIGFLINSFFYAFILERLLLFISKLKN